MIKVIALMIVAVLVKEGEAVAYGATCTKTSECEANKNLECRTPFQDCTKGYCLCPEESEGWLDDGCVLKYETNDAACSFKSGTMCQRAAGLKCKSNKCSCQVGTWNEESKVCKDDGTAVVVVGQSFQQCGSDKTCVAKSGKVTDCSTDKKCECATGYVYEDGTCKQLSKYDGACTNTDDCASEYKLKIEGETAKDVTTNFECKQTKCKCGDNERYVDVIFSMGFCKADNGTKAENAACADSGECAEAMICGKCPEATTKTCRKARASGATELAFSVILVVFSCFFSSIRL